MSSPETEARFRASPHASQAESASTVRPRSPSADGSEGKPPRRPDRSARVSLRMWRMAHPTADCEYLATVIVPRWAKPGDVLAIPVYIVEAEPMAGEAKGKRGFEGVAERAFSHMARTGTVEGDITAMPKAHRDLLTALEEHPFDDPLEGIAGRSTGRGPTP